MPYGIIFLLAVRLIVYLLKSESDGQNRNSKVKYLVNENIIGQSHIIHCKEMLGLTDEERITDEAIKQAYNQVFNDISERRRTKTVIIDIAELRAAKSYMMDRWIYMAHKN